MITLKCKNCGGEMSVNSKGGLTCPYCGSGAHFSDVEFDKYKNFRSELLNYLRAAADADAAKADDTFLWNYHDHITYYSADDVEINIDYLFYTEEDNVKTYVAKESIIYIFAPGDKNKVDSFIGNLKLVQYPSADIKNLSLLLPFIKANIKLKNGGTLIAVAKQENVYPLFAFGSIKPEHAAWIVSRLENLCCLFEFSELAHNGISINSVFINPRTHEVFLPGGWWKTYKKSSSRDKTDLYAIRKVAGQIIDEYKNIAPNEFIKFIKGIPAQDAYSDFELWDTVIEKGFGGHKFVKFGK